jgi:hypothetical protein
MARQLLMAQYGKGSVITNVVQIAWYISAW